MFVQVLLIDTLAMTLIEYTCLVVYRQKQLLQPRIERLLMINEAEVSTAAIIAVVRSQKLNVLGQRPDIRYQGRDNDPR